MSFTCRERKGKTCVLTPFPRNLALEDIASYSYVAGQISELLKDKYHSPQTS